MGGVLFCLLVPCGRIDRNESVVSFTHPSLRSHVHVRIHLKDLKDLRHHESDETLRPATRVGHGWWIAWGDVAAPLLLPPCGTPHGSGIFDPWLGAGSLRRPFALPVSEVDH